MKLYVMPEPLALALRKYLAKQPYEDVVDLIISLDNLNVATLTAPAEQPLKGAKKLAELVEDKIKEEKEKEQ